MTELIVPEGFKLIAPNWLTPADSPEDTTPGYRAGHILTVHGATAITCTTYMTALYVGEAGPNDWTRLLTMREDQGHERAAPRHIDANPWTEVPAYTAQWALLMVHLPRPSKDNPGVVAYFPDADYRSRSRLKTLKPRAYLTRYYGSVLTADEIETMAEDWIHTHAAASYEILTSGDDIEAAYTCGSLRSCMTYSVDDFHSSIHPVQVYGNSDLALAVVRGRTPDTLAARAIVWPERKLYGRVYGHEDKLIRALEDDGYRRGSDEDFAGARIRAILDPKGYYVCPYIDMAGYVHLSPDKKWLVLGRGDGHQPLMDCETTSGLADYAGVICAHCEEACDEDDTTYIEGHGSVCPHCLDHNFSYCEGHNEYVCEDAIRYVHGGSALCEDCLYAALESGTVFTCEGSGDTYHSHHYTEIVTTDGTSYEARWFRNNSGIQCDWSSEYGFEDEAVSVWPGVWVLTSQADPEDADYLAWLANNKFTDPRVTASASDQGEAA